MVSLTSILRPQKGITTPSHGDILVSVKPQTGHTAYFQDHRYWIWHPWINCHSTARTDLSLDYPRFRLCLHQPVFYPSRLLLCLLLHTIRRRVFLRDWFTFRTLSRSDFLLGSFLLILAAHTRMRTSASTLDASLFRFCRADDICQFYPKFPPVQPQQPGADDILKKSTSIG